MGCSLLTSLFRTGPFITMLITLVPVILFDNAYGICIFVCIPILFNSECVYCIHKINVNTNVLLPTVSA